MFQEKLSHVSNSNSVAHGKICELLLGASLHVGNVSKPKYLSMCPPALCLQLEAVGQCSKSDARHPLLDGQAIQSSDLV